MDVWASVAALLESGILYGHRKSCERAIQLKDKGNAYFAKSQSADTLQAVELYTEAIFCAPWSAEEQRKLISTIDCGPWLPGDTACTKHAADDTAILATCFGNRSAALYDLGNVEDCLADIGCALELGVAKASTLQKLHSRRSNCFSRRRRSDNGCHGDGTVRQLETCHGNLCVGFAKEKGRYMEATGTIVPGNCVLTEEPFAAVLKEGHLHTRCNHCFKEATLIPCVWCDVVGYCSPRCRSLSWRQYHWVECRAMHMWIKVDWMMQLCLRVVSTLLYERYMEATPGGVLNAMHSTDGDILTEEQGRTTIINSLMTHREEFMADPIQRETLGKMCDALAGCFGPSLSAISHKHSSTDDGVSSLRDLFLHHLLQLHCNSHSVTTTTTKDGGGMVDVGEVVLGTALYCRASLFNHSCFPNAICRFSDNQISVCVIQRLHPGDEVTICYGPQVGRMKMAERKAELKKIYHFDCKCVACAGCAKLQYMEVVADAFVCPSCGGPLESKEGGACCVCGHTPSCEEMQALHKRKDELQALYSTTSSGLDREGSRAALLKCHTLQSKILHKENRQLAKTRDTLAYMFAQNGDLERAAHYCELSCSSVEATLGDTSIELGKELHKLAVLLFQSQQVAKAAAVGQRAFSILSVYLSPGHDDCQELSQLLEEHMVVLKRLSCTVRVSIGLPPVDTPASSTSGHPC